MGNPLSSADPDRPRELVSSGRVAGRALRSATPVAARWLPHSRRGPAGAGRSAPTASRRPPAGVADHGQWLAHWLATRLRPRSATLRSYHQHIHQHLIPHLGGIVLRELCVDDVQTTFVMLARTPTRYGRARAASTLHRIRATLRVALNAAMRRGLIEANPARHVELPPRHGPRQWSVPRHAWRTGAPPASTPGSRSGPLIRPRGPPPHPPAPPLPAVPADHPGRTAPVRH